MATLFSLIWLLETLFGAGSSEALLTPPPQTAYWEVAIYGAATRTEELPLYLTYEGNLIGLCGAPVHAAQGNLSYCMTTARFSSKPEVRLSVEAEADWVLEVRYFRHPHITYLPTIGKD